MKTFLTRAVLLIGLLLALDATNLNAQLIASQQVGVTVTVTSQNSVSLSETGTLTFDPTTGQTGNITFSTSYNLDGTQQSIQLYTWFSNPAAALSTTAGNNIASSQIAATWTSTNVGSGSGVACNLSPGVSGVTPGGACQAALIISQGTSGGPFTSSGGSSITTTYSLAILNYGLNLKLAAGAYTGVLNCIAWAS